MDESKFIVGEEVAVFGLTTPGCNTDRATVTECKWVKGLGNLKGEPYVGYGYKASHRTHSSAWFREDSLKKLPPNELTSWEDCVFTPATEPAL